MTGPAVAVIPARYGSTRFPGKPLIDLCGVPMVVRVAQRAAQASSIRAVIVATDDPRIAAAVDEAGFTAVTTPADCPSGTDRVASAIQVAKLEAELIVNVQGDEPLIDPADIDAVVEETAASSASMGTLARPFDDPRRFDDPNCVKVVIRADGRALYFSRAPIPHGGGEPRLQHVGLYAYTPSVLNQLTSAPPAPLEESERLEQLRALHMGIDIHVAMARSATPSIAVDTPEDVQRVVEALEQSRNTRAE